MTERVTSDGMHGEQDMAPRPLPNRADAAWAELEALRVQARNLGIEVEDRWPIVRLREEIAAVKVARDQ